MAIYRVVAPHFVGGIVTAGGKVVKSAPIMKWAVGMSASSVLGFFIQKGWAFREIGKKVDK